MSTTVRSTTATMPSASEMLRDRVEASISVAIDRALEAGWSHEDIHIERVAGSITSRLRVHGWVVFEIELEHTLEPFVVKIVERWIEVMPTPEAVRLNEWRIPGTWSR